MNRKLLLAGGTALSALCYFNYLHNERLFSRKMKCNNHRVDVTSKDELPQASIFNELMERWQKMKAKHIGNYENRIRFFAHPHKRFTYFASITSEDGKFLMTSSDFVRSLIPYSDMAQLSFENQKFTEACDELTSLTDNDGDGYISYEEYLIMLNLLSISREIFEVAFKIYDKDGNGQIDYHEFSIVMDSSNSGISSRLGTYETFKFSETHNLKGILGKLFGRDGTKTISFVEFQNVLGKLRSLLLKCEYHMYNTSSQFSIWSENFTEDFISTFDFACSLLPYTQKYPKNIPDRLKARLNTSDKISFEEFENFDRVVDSSNKLEIGISLMASIDRNFSAKSNHGLEIKDFKKLVAACTGVTLSDHVLNVIFCIFDENEDGKLDYSELTNAIKSRKFRALNKMENSLIGTVLK